MEKIIVVVDDDDAVRDVLVRCLEPLNCSVQSFRNGQDALKYLRRQQARHVDLLIADSRLPGLSGEQLVEEFQRMKPAAPALIVSGEEINNSELAVINKPFSLSEFRRKVEMLLGK